MTMTEHATDPGGPPPGIGQDLDAAVTAVMNGIGQHRGCRPLRWTLRDWAVSTLG